MKRTLTIVSVLVLLMIGGGVAAYLWSLKQASEDVRGSSTEEFVPTPVLPPPPPPPAPGLRSTQVVEWPTYGFGPERRRVSPFPHRPPYRTLWMFKARTLIEFPPAIAHGRLYFANAAGVLSALNARTGERAWRFRSGRCAAASPAATRNVVYMAFLYRGGCEKRPKRPDGEIVALASGFGGVRWRRTIGASETSPVVAGGVVYVGDWQGTVWALDAANGRVRWTFRTRGPIKAALTLAGDSLYAASYDHYLYAISRHTGQLTWRSKVQPRLGKLGTFYSSPAAAYGRVYIGSTDGKVYSYGATTGELRWSHHTGGYVYGSPAVWGQRVYVGSYDRHFYAFDAATGDVVWRFRAGGRISGSATIVDGLVYFSTLEKRTYALDARTGRLEWEFADGQYSPVVADAERLYLVGYSRVYALTERSLAARAGRSRPEPPASGPPARGSSKPSAPRSQ